MHRRAHVIQAYAVVSERQRIDVHAHRGLRAAAHEHLSHAIHLGNLLGEDGVADVVDFGNGKDVRVQGEQEDGRVGRIRLAIAWMARQVGRKLAQRGVDGGLDVARRGIRIPAEIKLQCNVGRPELTSGRHLGDAGDTAK
jgi:hypothetical protein